MNNLAEGKLKEKCRPRSAKQRPPSAHTGKRPASPSHNKSIRKKDSMTINLDLRSGKVL